MKDKVCDDVDCCSVEEEKDWKKRESGIEEEIEECDDRLVHIRLSKKACACEDMSFERHNVKTRSRNLNAHQNNALGDAQIGRSFFGRFRAQASKAVLYTRSNYVHDFGWKSCNVPIRRCQKSRSQAVVI